MTGSTVNFDTFYLLTRDNSLPSQSELHVNKESLSLHIPQSSFPSF